MASIYETNKPRRRRESIDAEIVTLPLPCALLSALDDFRRTQIDTPTRQEAVSRLLAEVLRDRGHPPKV